MFARIEGDTVVAYPVDLQAEQPNTSFPWNWAGGEIEGVTYVRVTPTDVPQVDYTQNFAEGQPMLRDGVWYQAWIVSDATAEQIAERTDRKASDMRAERNHRLSQTDWAQLPDAPVDRATWADYRQALRDVTSQLGFPWEVTWPSAP